MKVEIEKVRPARKEEIVIPAAWARRRLRSRVGLLRFVIFVFAYVFLEMRCCCLERTVECLMLLVESDVCTCRCMW